MKVWSHVKTVLKVFGILIGLVFLSFFIKFYNKPMDGPEDVKGFRRITEALIEALLNTLGYIHPG